METKICPKCKKELPLDMFYKNKRYKDGKCSHCKTCLRSYAKYTNDNIYPSSTDGTKVCAKCGKRLPMTDFHAGKHNRDGRASYCKICAGGMSSNSSLKKRYGITIEEYDSMFKKQNNRCAICGREYTSGRRFHVDHNHTTKEIRGILCHNCNVAIGHANEDTDILRKMIEYLDK